MIYLEKHILIHTFSTNCYSRIVSLYITFIILYIFPVFMMWYFPHLSHKNESVNKKLVIILCNKKYSPEERRIRHTLQWLFWFWTDCHCPCRFFLLSFFRFLPLLLPKFQAVLYPYQFSRVWYGSLLCVLCPISWVHGFLYPAFAYHWYNLKFP